MNQLRIFGEFRTERIPYSGELKFLHRQLIAVSRAPLPKKVPAKFILELNEVATKLRRKLCAIGVDLNRMIEFVASLASVRFGCVYASNTSATALIAFWLN